MKLRPIDIPQADTLATVRQLVDAIASMNNPPVKILSERLAVHERHVRYRIAAAPALGFLEPDDGELGITTRGARLIATSPNSDEEKKELRRAVRTCPAVLAIDPDLLLKPLVDVKSLAERIVKISGLSYSTAERRAIVLRAWRRDLQ